MDYRNYINMAVHFDDPSDLEKIEDYLKQYPIISEINAGFLGCADPEHDSTVQKLIKQLNKDLNGYYVSSAPYTEKYDTLKCIYDMNRIKTPEKLIKIANVLYSHYFND